MKASPFPANANQAAMLLALAEPARRAANELDLTIPSGSQTGAEGDPGWFLRLFTEAGKASVLPVEPASAYDAQPSLETLLACLPEIVLCAQKTCRVSPQAEAAFEAFLQAFSAALLDQMVGEQDALIEQRRFMFDMILYEDHF
jgi:hypothetical protein